MKARKKVIQGGSSAGKTFGIIPILIDKACKNSNLEITVMSESVPHLKKGAMKDFIKIMKATNRWHESRFNSTDRKYKFANGSYIEFIPPNSVIGARRNILYVNEANRIKYQDYHQAAVRTSDDIYIDFNPTDSFWAHEEVLKETDSELLILTYKDNEGLPPNVVDDFIQARLKADREKHSGREGYWANWCKVYIDGEIGSLQGVVFNFEIIKEIPQGAERIGYGLDWGFSADPTALVKVCKDGTKLYVQELIYETGLLNSDIHSRFQSLGVPTHVPIIADSADPKSIADLKRLGGYTITGANKGQDSIRASIAKLQEYTIYVTEDSTNLIKELRNYCYLQDDTGKSTGVPIDAYNHAIDALRYVALNLLFKRTGIYNMA